MQHTDPDQLALIALGEPAEDRDVAVHLGRCARCRAELEALRRTADLGRETVDHRDEVRPPEPVWDRIAAELALPAGPDAAARPDLPPEPRRSGGGPGDGAGGPTTLERGRRRRRVLVGVGAAVAAVAVGVVGTLVAVRPWDGESGPAVLAATATLQPVAGGPGGASGRVMVVQGAAGPELDVTAAGLPSASGYYEVWVFDGGRDMVAVGVLGGDSTAALPLPPTLDLRRYRVVDISQEQYDGDQTHSTVSVLRGTLTG